MMNRVDLTGMTFGRWKVLQEEGKTKNGQSLWLCECTCGVVKQVSYGGLRGGTSSSCGCLRTELQRKRKSEGTGHPMYKTWMCMRSRCIRKEAYSHVSVCPRWESFDAFKEDMQEGFQVGLQIDRIDNKKGYSKENCRWVTCQQNIFNSGPKRHSSSKYKGVSRDKRGSTYRVTIGFNGKYRRVGIFNDEIEAARAYDKAARELFGVFAYQNFPEEE